MNQQRYQAAIAAFDKANAEDPNKETANGKEYPKELLYAQRMTEMQERYVPEASEAVKLACRAQHIQRWKSPRSSFPMDRQGYLQWRTGLYKFHAETAGKLMKEVGYDDEMIERVKTIVGKKGAQGQSGNTTDGRRGGPGVHRALHDRFRHAEIRITTRPSGSRSSRRPGTRCRRAPMISRWRARSSCRKHWCR